MRFSEYEETYPLQLPLGEFEIEMLQIVIAEASRYAFEDDEIQIVSFDPQNGWVTNGYEEACSPTKGIFIGGCGAEYAVGSFYEKIIKQINANIEIPGDCVLIPIDRLMQPNA